MFFQEGDAALNKIFTINFERYEAVDLSEWLFLDSVNMLGAGPQPITDPFLIFKILNLEVSELSTSTE